MEAAYRLRWSCRNRARVLRGRFLLATISAMLLVSGIHGANFRMATFTEFGEEVAPAETYSNLSYTSGTIQLGPPGEHPTSEVFDPVSGTLFVAFGTQDSDDGPSYVAMVSGQNLSLVRTVEIAPAGDYLPGALAVDTLNGDVVIATAIDQIVILSGASGAVIGNVTVGQTPYAVAYDSATNQIYVANFGSNNITVLNGSDFAPEKSISISFPVSLTFNPTLQQMDVVGVAGFTPEWYVAGLNDSNYSSAWAVLPPQLGGQTGPKNSAYDPRDGDLYVPVGSPDDDVLILNASNGGVVGTLPVGGAPYAAAYSARSNALYVSDSASDSLSVVNLTSFVNETVGVGGEPEGVLSDDSLGEVFVTNAESDTVSVIASVDDTVRTTVTLGFAPFALEYVPSLSRLISVGGMSLRLIDPPSQLEPTATTVGQYATGVAFDPVSDDLYVTNSDDGTISVVSSATFQVVSTIPVGAIPSGIVYDNESGRMLVTLSGANQLAVLSGTNGSTLFTVPVGEDPVGVSYDGARNLIFVTNYDSGNISVVSGATFRVIKTIGLPNGSTPTFPALDPSDGELFVPEWTLDSVTVVSDSSLEVMYNISVDRSAFAAAYDPVTGLVYVTNPGEYSLTAIEPDADEVVDVLPTGALPFGVACDTENGTVYVADEMSDGITSLTPNLPAPPTSPVTSSFLPVILGIAITAGFLLALVSPSRRRTG